MDLELYRRPFTAEKKQHVVKLLQNYRSHPSILSVPNKLFYDGELVAKGNYESGSLETWTGIDILESLHDA